MRGGVGKISSNSTDSDLVILMLKNLRKEALKFEAIVGYVVRHCLQTPKAEAVTGGALA